MFDVSTTLASDASGPRSQRMNAYSIGSKFDRFLLLHDESYQFGQNPCVLKLPSTTPSDSDGKIKYMYSSTLSTQLVKELARFSNTEKSLYDDYHLSKTGR